MSRNVDDTYAPVPRDKDRRQARAGYRPHLGDSTILGRIRNLNTLAMNSFGSLFSYVQPSAALETLYSSRVGSFDTSTTVFDDGEDNGRGRGQGMSSLDAYATDPDDDGRYAVTPTPSRPLTPVAYRFNAPFDLNTNSNDALPYEFYDAALSLTNQRSIASFSSGSESTLDDDTFPRTPDSIERFSMPFEDGDDVENDEDEDATYLRRYSREIKEGKRPARDLQDAFEEPNIYDETDQQPQRRLHENNAEWHGLQYTLKLSSRERRISENDSMCFVGESSKSRQSWVAMHQGHFHPFYEEAAYSHWRNWHRQLEREEELRRHRRGREFAALSAELALCFVEQTKTRDLMYRQIGTYGRATNDVRERLRVLGEFQKDPFFPQKPLNIARHLKRWRSVASLHELRPAPNL